MFIKRDAFGKLLFIKRLMILFFGVIVYYRHNVINKLLKSFIGQVKIKDFKQHEPFKA